MNKVQPDILFIIADDLNDWIGCYGGHPNTKTPNIDQLAGESVVFTNCYTPTPLCNPARTALLTGRAPWKTGIYGNETFFRDIPEFQNIITLPQKLQTLGYTTVSAGKIFHHATKAWSDPISWDYNLTTGTGGGWLRTEDRLQHGFHHLIDGYFSHTFDFRYNDKELHETGDWLNSENLGQNLNNEGPHFRALGLFGTHLPWYVPKRFFDMHPLNRIKLPKIYDEDFDKLSIPSKAFIHRQIDDVLRSHNKRLEAVQGYLAAISFIDECVGNIINHLKKSGKYDNTIIILTSDHGFHLGQKRAWSKYKPWREANRIPLIIKVPGITLESRRCRSPVSSLDIYPTLLEILGQTEECDYLDGDSITDLLSKPALCKRRVLFMSSVSGIGYRAACNYQYYFIEYWNGECELYNMHIDVYQRKNLASNPKYAKVVAAFKQKMQNTPFREKR